jgi:hypothetical protein
VGTVARFKLPNLWSAPKNSRLPAFQVHQSEFMRRMRQSTRASRLASSSEGYPQACFTSQPTPSLRSFRRHLTCKPSLIVCLASSRPAASPPKAQIPVSKEAPSTFLATVTLIQSVWSQIQPKHANRSRLVPGIVADRSPSQGGRSRLQSTSFEFSFISFFRTSSSSPRVSQGVR